MMHKAILIMYLLFICILISISGNGQTNAAEQVQQAFYNYQEAILSDRGVEAAEYVDSRTISYYDGIWATSIMADSLAVSSLGLLDKLMVLAIRNRTPKKKLLESDGKSLFIYAIEEGMIGKNSVSGINIGDVTLNGDSAKGNFISNGSATPFFFDFYKEQDAWKIDLTSIFSISESAFRSMQEESGLSENLYILNLLEMASGEKPNAEIWKPIKAE